MEKAYVNSVLKSADLKTAGNNLAAALDADILFFGGAIEWDSSLDLVKKCRERNRKTNVCLILVTTGGDANAAFRIARCLQQKYAEFNLFTPGWCKSAGTLIASGAHKIYMGDLGELETA